MGALPPQAVEPQLAGPEQASLASAEALSEPQPPAAADVPPVAPIDSVDAPTALEPLPDMRDTATFVPPPGLAPGPVGATSGPAPTEVFGATPATPTMGRSRMERRTGSIPRLTQEQVEPVLFDEPERDDGRRKLMIGLIIGGVVLLVAAAVLLLIILNRPAAPSAQSGTTVTAPSPTPDLTPSPNPSNSTFESSLPQRVNTYVFTGAKKYSGWKKYKPIEAWQATYTDGEHEITLLAAQWVKPEAAQNAENQMDVPDKVVQPAEGTPDPAASVNTSTTPSTFTWRNKTAIYQVKAPAGVDPQLFYQGFPF